MPLDGLYRSNTARDMLFRQFLFIYHNLEYFMSEDIERLSELCRECLDSAPCEVSRLPGAGGDRVYYRMRLPGGMSVIGVRADSTADARAFVSLTGVFSANGVPVPQIYGHTSDFRYYLENDLGDDSLFTRLGDIGSRAEVGATMRALARMQSVSRHEWRDLVAYGPFSRRQAMWDLNYFKYEFLKPADIAFDEDSLEDDLERLAGVLLDTDESEWGFMMRDCQSRNVMLAPGPVFIDYQGGRYGPCIYDAVSFLWQARAGFSATFRREMLEIYAGALSEHKGVDISAVLSRTGQFALFRTLQVLGAYGFRGLVQRRAHFIESIPGALANLTDLIDGGELDAYPELKKASAALVTDSRFRPEGRDGLRVKVFSFSYKRGYPEDLTGNGGGFMFDCRGMHNPGRYAEYRHLTGRDRPVIDFLKEKGEADIFAAKAYELVAPSVSRYLKRGFSSLQVGFGCTGGQHRSVYCAEAVAKAIASNFPAATVELIHREQGIRERLKIKD